jgi:DNA-binding GntR family transcriptional regulator
MRRGLAGQIGVVPINRETVQERVHRQLRDLLMSGRFQPGQPLVIQDVAKAFGTSAQPVREAIRQLVAEKALEASPNRSVCVPVLDRERMEDLRRARLAIEGLALELAAERITDDDIEALAALVEDEVRADDESRPDVSVAQNQAFHFGLYRLSGSTVLPPIIESLWLQVGPYIRRAAEYFDAREGRGAEFHLVAIEALKRRDVAALRAAIESDINRSFDLCIELERESKPAA